MKKRLISLVVCVSLLLTLSCAAYGESSYLRHVTDEEEVEPMLAAIEKQNFSNAPAINGRTCNAASAREWIEFLLYDSQFAVFGGEIFPYFNSLDYWVTVVNDSGLGSGKEADVKLNEGSKGCKAYALYVSELIYGAEDAKPEDRPKMGSNVDEFKEFIQTKAQAGEQLRMYKNSSNQHSIAYISCDDNGFYALSYNGDPSKNRTGRIDLNYYTYEGFFNKYGSWEVFCCRNINQSINQLHDYNELGICTDCGKKYSYRIIDENFTCSVVQYADSKLEPSGAYPTQNIIPEGSVVQCNAYTTNHYGNVWYRMTNGEWICSDRCEKGAGTPVISISGQKSPDKLAVGKNFGIRGVISVNVGVITSVSGAIINDRGETIQSGYYTPGSETHDLRYSVNNDLKFGSLPEGTYSYVVTATATNGNLSATSTLIDKTFVVGNG